MAALSRWALLAVRWGYCSLGVGATAKGSGGGASWSGPGGRSAWSAARAGSSGAGLPAVDPDDGDSSLSMEWRVRFDLDHGNFGGMAVLATRAPWQVGAAGATMAGLVGDETRRDETRGDGMSRLS